MYVPNDVLGALHVHSPKAGSEEAITEAMAFVRDAAKDCTRYCDGMRMALRGLSSGQSVALTKLKKKAQILLPGGAQMLESSLETAEACLREYRSQMQYIHGYADRLLERVEHHFAEIAGCAIQLQQIAVQINRSVEMSWNSPPPEELPTPYLGGGAVMHMGADELQEHQGRLVREHSYLWELSVRSWNSALRQIYEHRKTMKDLYQTRLDAEERLVVGLRSSELGRLIEESEESSYTAKATIAYSLSGELWGEKITDTWHKKPKMSLSIRMPSGQKEIVNNWKSAGFSLSDLERLPIPVLIQLCQLDGLPSWVRDFASKQVLHYAITSPEKAYAMFGFTEGDETTLNDFRSQIIDLFGAWSDSIRDSQKILGNPKVKLLTIGNHNGQLVAAISLGDTHTAHKVGINVPGMGSEVGGIRNALDGSEEIYRSAVQSNPNNTYSVVTWFGYNSPDMSEVMKRTRADAGAERLVSFLNGLDAARERPGSTSGFTVFAHSYGSTTAAIALVDSKLYRPVDSFVSYGSAGFTPEIRVKSDDDTSAGFSTNEIQAKQTFSTIAELDKTARLGQIGNRHDPASLGSQVQQFSAETTEKGKTVNGHSMYTDIDEKQFVPKEVGYLSPGTVVLKHMGHIFTKGEL